MVLLRYFEKFGGYLARPIPQNFKNSYLTVWTLGNAIFTKTIISQVVRLRKSTPLANSAHLWYNSLGTLNSLRM
jgi:hypothetical protein